MIVNLIIVLHALIVLAFTLRILVREDLSPPARLAWFVILLGVPYAGAVIYFLFGEIDLGEKAKERHDNIFRGIRKLATEFLGNSADIETEIDPLYRAPFRYGASINGFQPVPGNRAEVMADAEAARHRMVVDMDQATNHIHVLYYIWLEDTTGTAIAEALIRAAKRGVTCRAIADGLGSRGLIGGPLWKAMEEAGVELAVAFPLSNPVRTMLTSRIDLRNHRKITVIDSHITFCGSQNSADPEFRVKAKYAPWVDILLRFEGPVAAQNQLLFASDWMQATGEIPRDIQIHATHYDDGFMAQVIGDGPTERRAATPQLFATLIAAAQKELVLTTPYFVPDTLVLEALCTAAYRGVQITLILPERNDSWIVATASKSYYRRLLEAGCDIFEYRGGLLHAKTLTVDGQIALVGSSNIDLRSFDLNYENNILLSDETLTADIRLRQMSYLAQSDPVHLFTVLTWPFYKRIWQNVFATIGPVL